MDIVFVTANGLADVYGELYHSIMTIEPPVWAQILSGAVKKRGYEARIIDCIVKNYSMDDLKSELDRINPKLVVFMAYGQHPSASTHMMHGIGITLNYLSQFENSFKTLVIGGHVSALPDKTMREEKCDFVAKGEGVETLFDLLELDSTDLNLPEKLKKVRGLFYRDRGEVKASIASPMIEQSKMDLIYPGLDHEGIDYHKYRAPNWFCLEDLSARDNYAVIYTSLGCPFKCSFCSINAPFSEKKQRTWAIDTIMKDIDYFHNQGVHNLKIADEMFVLNENHYLEICKEMARADYNFKMWSFARVDTIKEKNLKLLKDAGMKWFVLGVESVSQNDRSAFNKGSYSEEKIRETVKMIHDHGMHVHANIMFGLPDDNLDSMQRNLDFVTELNIGSANFYCSMPYPGSELYFEALKSGAKMPKDWNSYSQHNYEALPLPTKHLSASDVLTFRDQAWKIYHANPQYHEYVEKNFSKEGANYIRELANGDVLKRKYGTNKTLAKVNY